MKRFICECCHKYLACAWDEEECIEEKKQIFGDMPLNEMAKVCDDCYTLIMKHAVKLGIHKK